MCDTLVATRESTVDGAVWFAKNSDRERDEAQVVEVIPARRPAGPRQRCTWISIASAPSRAVVLSRPVWMWGAEMGVNEDGVAVGNQAVFTRMAPGKPALTGMDLVRLALERAGTAREAVEVITGLLDAHGQGGPCSRTHPGFRYDNAFLIADAREAWHLETAGSLWAAQRLSAPRTLSNALSLGRDFDLVHPEAETEARRRGAAGGERLDFAAAFGDPVMRVLAGARERSACTLGHLQRDDGRIDVRTLLRALRDHGHDGHPLRDLRMTGPCSHGSRLPTRVHGQTTASMIVRLSDDGPRILATGAPAPCLSAFKPVVFDLPGSPGPVPALRPDGRSLFWLTERLHTRVLRRWGHRAAAVRASAGAIEQRALAHLETPMDADTVAALWADDHGRVASLVAQT